MTDFSNILLTNYEQMLSGHCTHLTYISFLCVSCISIFNGKDASSFINQKASLISKEITVKDTGGVWYNTEIREVKKVIRKTEKLCHEFGND